MANHPNRHRNNVAYFDGNYGYLTIVGDDTTHEVITTKAHPDRYIRIDDGKQYPQLCAGGSRSGNTLSWAPKAEEMGKWFARDCDARLFKTRTGYDRARAKAAGYYVREGSYTGTTDDRLGRWYFGHESDNGFRPYGAGYGTQQEAWEAALEHASAANE